HTVLGHCLTFLALPVRPQELKPHFESHRLPPSRLPDSAGERSTPHLPAGPYGHRSAQVRASSIPRARERRLLFTPTGGRCSRRSTSTGRRGGRPKSSTTARRCPRRRAGWGSRVS